MSIRLEFLEPFDKFGSKTTVPVKGGTVKDLISVLIKKHGNDFKKKIFNKDRLDEGVMLLVNGVSIMGNLKTKLKNNDKVVLSRTISGG